MSPELRALFHGLLEGGAVRRLSSAVDVESLDPQLRAELIGLHDECFGIGADPPSAADLARLMDGILLSEDLLEKALYWDAQARRRAWEDAAAKLGWPTQRLHELDRWWRASSHHREF